MSPFDWNFRRSALAILILAISGTFVGITTSVLGADERIRGLVGLSPQVESEPRVELGFEPPPRSYPLEAVRQELSRGTPHGLLTTAAGGLVFKMVDLRLPGRMPIEISRVYDSTLSDFLPPSGRGREPRYTADLGENWIFAYSAYLIFDGSDIVMATTEGDVIKWVIQPDGSFEPALDVPSRFTHFEQGGPGELVATDVDGTRWIYSAGVAATVSHGLTKVMDRSGNYIELVYQAGLVREIRNSDGASVILTRPCYDGTNPPFSRWRITRVTDHTGREIVFDYTAEGNLISVTDAQGHEWTYGYDAFKKVTSATDPLGNEFLSASYDTAHRLSSYEADAGLWAVDYGVSGEDPTTATDALGNTWEYHHDANGVTTRIHEPTGGVHQLIFDAYSNPVAYSGPEGIAATWTYDDNHRPTSFTPPGVSGGSIAYQYDVVNEWLDSVTSLSGGTTVFVRDASGRVVEEQRPDGGVLTATYAANGDRLTMRLPKGNEAGGVGYEWQFGYDSSGNVTSATDPTGRVFELEYTSAGDLWKLRRPDHEDLGQTVYAEWVYDRDLLGRLTTSTDPLGNAWNRTYDDAGRVTTNLGPEGTRLEYGYDSRYRLTSVTVEDGVTYLTTTYGYDAAGRLTSKTLPSGATWHYGYDGSSRLVSITDPENRAWAYTRDLAGHVTTEVHPGGQQVIMQRNNAGQLTSRLFPGTRVETFQYNAFGRLASAEATEGTGYGAWTGSVSWLYDVMGRPSEVTTDIYEHPYGTVRTLIFTYDVNGNRVSLSSLGPGSENVTYSYDELDRVIATSSDILGDWQAQYDPISGHRTNVSADGGSRWENWTYDLAGRPITHDWSWPNKDAGSVAMIYDGEGRVISQQDVTNGVIQTITYADSGVRAQVHTTDASETRTVLYGYDSDSQLVEATFTSTGQDPETAVFDWDSAGRLVYARRANTVRDYTWEDSPGDPEIGLRVWRSPDGLSERSVEVQFGLGGRLRRIQSWDALEDDPTLIAEYHWSALGLSTALQAEELIDVDTYEIRKMARDVAGPYAEQGESGNITRLLSPVAAIDNAGSALSGIARAEHPPFIAPFTLGTWPEAPLPNVHGATAQSTGVWSTSGLIQHLTAREQRPDTALATFDRVRLSQSAFIDDWLGEAVFVEDFDRSQGTRIASPSAPPASPPVWSQGLGVNDASCRAYGCVDEGTPNAQQLVCNFGVTEIAEGPGPTCPKWYFLPPGFGPGGGGGEGCGYDFATEISEVFTPRQRGAEVSYGVSLINGEFIESATDVTAYDPSGAIPFTRTYRQFLNYNGSLGHRWFHNYEDYLDFGHDQHEGLGDDYCGYIVRWIQPGMSYVDFFWNPDLNNWETAGDAVYRIRQFEQGESTWYEIRSSDGTVRYFNDTGKLKNIKTLKNTLTLNYDVDGVLKSISSSTAPADPPNPPSPSIHFLYFDETEDEKAGKLRYVSTATTGDSPAQPDGDFVEYDYSTCGELAKVMQRPVKLGYDQHGQELTATVVPTVHYEYSNANLEDCDHSGTGFHLLTTISVQQYDPLTDQEWLDQRIENQYYDLELGANDFANRKVSRQILGDQVRDITYLYSREPGAIWEDVVHTTTVVDDRLPDDTIQTKYEYRGNKLTAIVEDFGDGRLNRTTEYSYDFYDLVSKIKNADGSCTEYENSRVAGISFVWKERKKEAAYCESLEPGPTDILTSYAYEPLTGQVRTITTPLFTVVYDYDVNQTDPGGEYPPDLQDYLADWAMGGPAKLGGGINGSCTDDDQWLGELIRVRLQPPTAPEVVMSTRCTQPTGRPTVEHYVNGTSREYEYYTEATSSGWDWRLGSGSAPTSTAGSGPSALVRVVPDPGAPNPNTANQVAPLATYFAWDERSRLIAEQDPVGVRKEQRLAANGKILEQIICAPTIPATSCDGSIAEHNVLTITRQTYDLRGRLRRAATHGGDPQEPAAAVEWFTYDNFDQLQSKTVDPNPSITPGDFDPAAPGSGFLHLVQRTFYDDRGRVSFTVSPAGRATCLEYDALDQLVTSRRYARLHEDGTDCPTEHADDVVESFDYDAMGRLYRTTDPESNYLFKWYDGFGRLRFTSDGKPTDAQVPEFLGNPPQPSPDPATWFEESRYSLEGRIVMQRFYGDNGLGESGFLTTTWSEYDDYGRRVKTHTPLVQGFAPQSQPDPDQPPTGDPTVPLATTEVVYGANQKPHYRIDPMGRQVEFNYDGHARLVRTTLPPPPGGSVETDSDFVDTVHQANGLVASTISVNRYIEGDVRVNLTETVRNSYDFWGRIVDSRAIDDSTVGAGDAVTTTKYDVLGRPLEIVSRWLEEDDYDDWHTNDKVTCNEYDKAGRRLTTKQRLSGVASSCDATGDWATSVFSYDEDGLKTSLIDPNGNVTNWDHTLDPTDPTLGGLGRVRLTRYPATVVGGDRETIAITQYDRKGSPLVVEYRSAEDANSAMIRFTNVYDVHGGLTSKQATPVNVESMPDPPEFFGTTFQEFVYDDLGRVVKATDRSETDFDLTEQDIVSEFQYGTAGHLIRESQWLPVDGSLFEHSIEAEYDADGFRRELTYPKNAAGQIEESRYSLEFVSDYLGRLAEVLGPDVPQDPSPDQARTLTKLVDYDYLGSRVWSRWHRNETESRFYEGDPTSPVSLIDSVGRVAGVRTVVSGGVGAGDAVADFRYGYDRLNNRIYEQRLHEPIEGPVSGYRTRAFTYDHGSRLTKWYEGNLGESPIGPDVTDPASQISAPSDKELWTLDSAANWTSHKAGTDHTLPDTLGGNTLNQYTQIAYDGDIGQVKAFEYDWRGQMRENEARGHRYVWDAFGRLTKVLNEAGTAIVTYRYDAFNRRVEKAVDSAHAVYDESVTRYIYDGWRVIEERDLLGESTHYESVRARYGYGIGFDEVIWMDRAVTFGAAIDNRYFLHQDAHGSVVAVSGDRTEVGQPLEVQERFTYSAYGAMTAWTGSWQSASGAYPASQSLSDVGVAFTYTGQRYDAETGLYSFKNRSYDPELGRFVSRDPLGYLGGPSLYQYAASDPVSMTDPLGLVAASEGVLRYEFKQCSYGAVSCMSGTGTGALIHRSGSISKAFEAGQARDAIIDKMVDGKITIEVWVPHGSAVEVSDGEVSIDGTPVMLDLGPTGDGSQHSYLMTNGFVTSVDVNTGEVTKDQLPTADQERKIENKFEEVFEGLTENPHLYPEVQAGYFNVSFRLSARKNKTYTDRIGRNITITLGIRQSSANPPGAQEAWSLVRADIYHEWVESYYIVERGYDQNLTVKDAHSAALISEMMNARELGVADSWFWVANIEGRATALLSPTDFCGLSDRLGPGLRHWFRQVYQEFED